VANKSSGIDVDKWDYFLRDDYHLNIGHVFKYERFISFSRIMKTGFGDRTKICMRDKEAELVEEMFRDRARLHLHGYQHRVTKIIDRMMVRYCPSYLSF
jgi:HD superfamily phosphohydrolase